MPDITWQEFKNEVSKSEIYKNIIYRGHASSTWKLEPTLLRHFRKKSIEKMTIRSSEYHQLITSIKDEFKNLDIPALSNKNPFLISIMFGDEQHESEIQNAFSLMLELRHLGFPSPIIDWTHNFYIAAKFALLDSSTDECIIYCLCEKILPAPYTLNLFEPNFFIIPNQAIKTQPERHQRQESAYSICPYNADGDYHQGKRDTIFYLPAEELLIRNPYSKFELIKFNITDIENVHDNLNKLGITSEYLYGNLRIEEKKRLRDIAEKIVL